MEDLILHMGLKQAVGWLWIANVSYFEGGEDGREIIQAFFQEVRISWSRLCEILGSYLQQQHQHPVVRPLF